MVPSRRIWTHFDPGYIFRPSCFFLIVSIDWKRVNEELKIPKSNLTPLSKKPRELIFEHYVGLPRGFNDNNTERIPSVDNSVHGQIHSILYTFNDFEYGILAPGKEAMKEWSTMSYHRDGSKRKMSNHNDALPIVTKQGARVWEKELTFEEIFDLIHQCFHKDKDGLIILAALLFNMAFCFLHEEEKTAQGAPKLKIPPYTLSMLREKIGTVSHKEIGDIPIDVFVHFIDILATNEDAKVHALGLKEFKANGRTNTILTCVNVIAVILGEQSFIKFASTMGRNNGMAPISQTLAKYAIFSRIEEFAN